MIHEGHNKCKTNNVTNEKIFIYYKNLNVCVCVRVSWSFFTALSYIISQKKYLMSDCGIKGFLLILRSTHIQTFNIYIKEEKNTQKNNIYGCKEHIYSCKKSKHVNGKQNEPQMVVKTVFLYKIPNRSSESREGKISTQSAC